MKCGAIALGVLLAAWLGAAPVRAADLDWDVLGTPAPGQTITVIARLSDVGGLLAQLPFGYIEGAEIGLDWDSARLELLDSRPGSGFAGSQSIILDRFPDPPPAGTLSGLLEAVQAPALTEGFALLELDFRVLSSTPEGSVGINYAFDIQEGAALLSGNFTVAALSVPIPLAVLLALALGLGLAVVAPEARARMPELADRLAAPAEPVAGAWEQLAEASAPGEFAVAWLPLQCRAIARATSGLVLLGPPNAGPYAPAAVWPNLQRDLDYLMPAVQRAVEQRRAVVEHARPATADRLGTDKPGNPGDAPRVIIAWPLLVSDVLHGVVVIELEHRSDEATQDALRQLHWGMGWLELTIRRRQTEADGALRDRLVAALDLLATATEQSGFEASASAFVNELATRLACDRVSIGFVVRKHIKVQALSHSAHFGRQMNLVNDLAAAMEEAVDQREPVVYPRAESVAEPGAGPSAAGPQTVARPPVAESSVAESSVAGSSVAESSVAGSSVAESSVAGSSVAESSVAGSSVAESSVAGSPVAGSPVAGSPVAGSAVAESPVAGSPVAGSPVTDSPVAQTPAAQSPASEPPASEPLIDRAVVALARKHGSGAICSVPFFHDGEAIGALVLEQPAERPFTAEALSFVQSIASLVGPVLEARRSDERGSLQRAGQEIRDAFEGLLGARHLVAKSCALLIGVTVLVAAFVETEYRVTARTRIEAAVQRSVVAPVSGYVTEALKRAGDLVSAGDVLVALDDRDLRLERLKWAAEREQLVRQQREAMAADDASKSRIVKARVDQAEVQLALVDEQIARLRVLAPFDGLVISGDLSQKLGAPVDKGAVLFEIAPLDRYRVVLQVDERDVATVTEGQTGSLALAAVTGNVFPLRVTAVTPVSTAEGGRNYFRVEAELVGLDGRAAEVASINLRPGMEGVGKVAVGERSLLWAWTHGLTDWLRLQLWALGY